MSEVDYDAAVAVIGMSGRFPGAGTVDELWANLAAGRPGLRELSEEELLKAGVGPAQLADPSYVRVAGGLEDVELFDAGVFGFSRIEAEAMDPQHRLFLEVSWEALERAGYSPMAVPGRGGVFAGSGYSLYALQAAGRLMAEPGGTLLMAIGTERDSLSSLLSYKLDLRGPSVTVQTFCSTSLVSVHLAVQSLLNYECEFALAGGSFIPLGQGVGYTYHEGDILAPDGVVRAFDADARGSVVGSGVAVVVLKRLSDALADNDHIEAVILGSAVNNDGRACAGYTAPGVDGQAEVMRQAVSFAGVPPETISYIECHGTGTMLGDSIELAAMARAFPAARERPIVLGSVKPSIGHLDRASGTSSLIRAMMAMNRAVLPATPNYTSPNPALAAVRDRFTVLTEDQPWPASAHPRRAGVSSFGLGGTNAHVVIEEPPARPESPRRSGPQLLLLSARDETALDMATRDLADHLAAHPGLRLDDVAFTLQQSRAHFPVRRAVVCADVAEAVSALADPARRLAGETRSRDPLIDIDLPEPSSVPEDWWQELRLAAGEITGELIEPVDAESVPVEAVVAFLTALTRLGGRLGRVSGGEGAARLVTRVTERLKAPEQEEGQVRLSIAPVTGESAARWQLATLARLWLAGSSVDWAALHPGGGRRVPLPTYPFQRRRYWIEAAPPAPAAVDGRVDDLSRWTYVPGWRHAPAAIADRDADLRAAGPWLVLAGQRFGADLVERLRRAGADVVAARPGSGFGGDARTGFTVRPDDPGDLDLLLRGMDRPPRTVVHAVGRSGEAETGMTAGFRSVLTLAGALATHVPTEPVSLLTVTRQAVGIAGSVPRNPEQAAVGGLLPVLAQENPGWQCRHVDVDDNVLASSVLTEAVTEHEGPVALRGTGRWVREYEHLPLPATTDGPLAPGSVVLITGGLGHVGLILARHLAARRGCRVVLTGRTALPERDRWREHLAAADPGSRSARTLATLVELVEGGAEVVVESADTADERQMRAVVERTLSRFGRIDLVVHAAGSTDPAGFGPATMLTQAACDAHFITKVEGFRTLRNVLDGCGDVRGITLSSLSAVLGGLALGAYGAANAALDTRVLAERGSTRARWITVDWDTWGLEAGQRQSVGHTGAFDMRAVEAVEIFERAVAAIDEVDHLVISTGSLDARYEQWVVGSAKDEAPEEEEIRDPRPELSTPYVEPAEGMERTLADIWAGILRLESIGAEDDFYQLGGNSVLAISLIARVRKQLGIAVPVTAMLGYPTVRGLAGQLSGLVE
ncbi:SDR family oxidoreductase [Nonomuraea sp. NPDC049158]|uniref:SDR family oxidoreductase n=1 Tax=Nonomuraea sp. NPDC049158 TaxID=3155649 RepID=UPI0033C0DE89